MTTSADYSTDVAAPRFGPMATLYDLHRPHYPEALIDTILAQTEGRQFAIDLGTGTGRTLPPLLAAFASVLAVEPDAEMAALLPTAPNLTVAIASAETAALPVASADLVTCGTAFHWMDGPVVLSRLRAAMAPRGLLAIFTYYRPDPGPAAKRVIEGEFAARWNAHKHDRLNRQDYAARQVEAHAGFSAPDVQTITHHYALSAAALAGFYASTSYGAAYLRTLDDPSAYLDDLASRLAAAAGTPILPAVLPITLVLARPSSDRSAS